MEFIFLKLKRFIMKRYDIIHRVQAPYFVEFDLDKIDGAIKIFKKRKEKIRMMSKMPKNAREELMATLEEVILLTEYLGSSNMLKLRDVEVKTKEQLLQEQETQQIATSLGE